MQYLKRTPLAPVSHAALKTSPGFWLDLQQRWNLYQAMHSDAAKDIERIEPIGEANPL